MKWNRSKQPLIFLFGYVFLGSVAPLYSQAPSRSMNHAEASGHSWLTNFYGKTLSSIGDIIAVTIEREPSTASPSSNRTHNAVWRIIEHAKIQDLASMGVAVGVRPRFKIEYANGMRVEGSRYAATITLPNDTGDAVVLAEESGSDFKPLGDLVNLPSIPDPQSISNVTLVAGLNAKEAGTLDTAGFRKLLERASPASPDLAASWHFLEWYRGSFVLDDQTNTFGLYLGGIGVLTQPNGIRGLFKFK